MRKYNSLLVFFFLFFLYSSIASGQSIFGSIVDGDGVPIPGGGVRIYDSIGNDQGTFWADGGGDWHTHPLPDDDYFAVTIIIYDYVDEYWDNIDGSPCPNQLCDATAVGAPIPIEGGADFFGVNFAIETISGGGHISGNLSGLGQSLAGNWVGVSLLNSAGEYLDGIQTGQDGHYQTGLLSDDTYYVRTKHEPLGLARELFDNHPCVPAYDCDDPAYIPANGRPVVIPGVDPDPAAIDFDLALPVTGHTLSGKIKDALNDPGTGTNIPMTEVQVHLLDSVGNQLAHTWTDQYGDYYFSGLLDDDYKVYTSSVPNGYTPVLFPDTDCANWECDIENSGTAITVDGVDSPANDITLTFAGTRIFGTVTRSDNDDPATHEYERLAVILYDDTGEYVHQVGTDIAGQYQFDFGESESGNYFLTTDNHFPFHGLINEAWDDVPCFYECDPPIDGATLVPVVGSNTVIANFQLDPGFVISGTISFEGSPSGDGYVNIWDDQGVLVSTAWNDGGGNWSSDILPPGSYYATTRGEDWGMVSQVWQDQPCAQEYCDIPATGTAIVLPGDEGLSIDFDLVPQSLDWTISGSIKNSEDQAVGGGVLLIDPDGNHLDYFWTDEFGNFQTHALANGTYFAITVNTNEMLDEAWQDIPCPSRDCDPTTSSPIVVDNDNVEGIHFVLAEITSGGRISGHVTGLGAPLANIGLSILNRDADHLLDLNTNEDGYYETPLLANGDYFVHTIWEPLGLGSELYDNRPCIPSHVCRDPDFVKANADRVPVENGDQSDIDFDLVVPPDLGMISGRVTDAIFDMPLPDVHVSLLNAYGHDIDGANTDGDGMYYFSALDDGSYKVVTDWVPDGYLGELYHDVPCHERSCDMGALGVTIEVVGASHEENKDFALNFSGTRIFGTVRRSDSVAPVTNQFGEMVVKLFDAGGGHIGDIGTNSAGQYQYTFTEGSAYYLSTRNNDGYHQLIDEAWDNVPCLDNCNPKTSGGELISIATGESLQRDFVLDPLPSISGTVTKEDAPLEALDNIEVCVTRRDGNLLGCANTNIDGDYTITGLYPEDDLVVFVNDTNGQPYQLETYIDLAYGDWGLGEPVNISTGSETGIDFALAPGFFISGTVLEAEEPYNAVEGVSVCVDRIYVSFNPVCSGTDSNGIYQLAALPAATDYVVYVIPEHLGYKREMWNDVPCPDNNCEYSNGTPITLGPDHAPDKDFSLERDTGITGTLRRADNGETLGYGEGRIWLYKTDGTPMGSVRTEHNGFYRFSDIAADDYYVLAGPNNDNLIVELWNGPVAAGVPCPGLTCNPASLPGAVIAVAESNIVDNIDVDLDAGSRITGHVRLNGDPVDQAYIYIYDDSGAYLRYGITDGSGLYQSRSGFPPGSYRAANRRTVDGFGDQNLAYIPMAYSNQPCGDPCDVTVGNPIVIDGPGDVPDKDFDFVEEPKSTISGHILDHEGHPNPGGGVEIFNSAGEWIDTFWVNEFGYFETFPLSPDSYFAWTVHTGEYVAAYWDDLKGGHCPNKLCNVLDGSPILVSGGVNETDIDFWLDPIEGGGRISGHITGLGVPLPKMAAVILNRNGDYLMQFETNADGFYETQLLSNDTYLVHTYDEPLGLGRELYNDHTCIPKHWCEDPFFAKTNGDPVPIENNDHQDTDFDLIVPPDLGVISGFVHDADLGIPMPDVQMALFDSQGNQIDGTHTDKDGIYYFSGLDDGDYKVMAHGVPHGYSGKLFDSVDCPDWECDTRSEGLLIPIILASTEDSVDFALSFSGTRFIGTVTRSDTGEPVTHNYERMAAIIYDAGGAYVDQIGTNSAGQYSFLFDDGGSYWLATDNDLSFHGLMNEGWDGVDGDGWKCFADCDFPNENAVLISIDQGQTLEMNFDLDPLPTISGKVTTDDGPPVPLQDVEVCVTRRDGNWLGCTNTDIDGDYTIMGLYPEDDLVVFVNNTNGQPYLLETYDDKAYGDWDAADGVNISASSETGIDFLLAPGFFISGTVLDPDSNPLEGLAVCIHRTDGSFTGVCADTNASGFYEAGTLPAATDYVAYVIPEHLGYQREMWDNEPCPFNRCDFSAGWPITVGPDHATNKDFILKSDTGITGVIRRSATGEPLSVNEGRARLYRADGSGETIGAAFTDDTGFYRFSGLSPGNYFVLATPNNDRLIDELWNGPHEGVHCPRLSCETTALKEAVIAVTEGSIVSGIDVDLDEGSLVTGHLSLQGSTDPVAYTNVYLYSDAGVFAGFGRSDGNGDYATRSGFPEGHYYVSNRLIFDGYASRNEAFVPMVYENVPCGYPCDVRLGETVGVDGEHDIEHIDFEFIAETEVTISGSIKDNYGNPTPGGAVRILNADGSWEQDYWLDGNGQFATNPLAPGVYFAMTFYPQNFIHDRWDGEDGEQCPNLLCDFYGGEPIVIGNGVSASGIDFKLDPIVSGATISGRVEDSGFTPLPGIGIVIFNNDGIYLTSGGTDVNGDYESQTLLNGSYYVRTDSEPLGLGRELYDNKPCLPVSDCDHPPYITGTGTRIDITGNDVRGINFTLDVPPTGHTLSGKITDNDINAPLPTPLPDVQVHLMSADGDHLADTSTDRLGDYYFSGLPDGDYKVYAWGVPPGYTGTVYPDAPCHEWNCDFRNTGVSIPLSGGHSPGNDIVLTHSGTRIFGTVKRSDNDEPVSGQFGWASVVIYDDNGVYLDQAGTNSAGQYAFYLDEPGDYYLTTENDSNFHGLINEGWDNWQCFDDCGAVKDNVPPVTILGGQTLVRNFDLEAAPVIRGVVSAEGGSGLKNINVCVSRQADNQTISCNLTATGGSYELIGLPPRDDLVVWIRDLNGQPYFREMHEDLPCCDISQGTTVDVTGSDREINFQLAPSASLSGTVLDSSSSPLTGIEDVTVQLLTAQCNVVETAVSGSDGAFTISGFNDPGAVYYLAAYDNNQYYINTLYPQINRYDVCLPDVQDGVAITVGHLEHKGGLFVAMDPGGSISGHISDENGDSLGWKGQARLSDVEGNIITATWQDEWTHMYRLGGLLPGSYHLVFSSWNLGLIDERWDDVPCPRNSCPLSSGTAIPVGIVDGLPEDVINKNASLRSGSVIRGRITDIATPGEGVPGGYEIFFYTVSGRYAGYAYTDEDGYYNSATGFPEGEYIASNQVRQNDYQPVYLGYLPQVWTEDGSFGDCGEPCDFMLGDRFYVNGLDPREDINLVLQRGSTISGTVRDTGASPLANIELRLLNSVDGSVIRTVLTDELGAYAFEGVGAGSYYLRTRNTSGYVDLLWGGLSGAIPCSPSCIPFDGEIINTDGSNAYPAFDFDLQSTPEILGKVTFGTDEIAGVRVEAFNRLGDSVAHTTTNAAGDYFLANLWEDTFYVRTFNNVGLVDALYDGHFCEAGEETCDPTEGTSIPVVSGPYPGFDLQLGTTAKIWGAVSSVDGPISGVTVELYRDDGDFVTSAMTNGAGAYSLEGLTGGNYHLVTRNNFGYIDEGAGGRVCQSDCPPTSTELVHVATNTELEQNFLLELGGAIAGTVYGDGESALPGVTVAAFNADGDEISSSVTSPYGTYTLHGLVGDSVYLRTFNAGEYRNQSYNRVPCDTSCNVLEGTVINAQSGELIGGKDFHLESGYSISGRVTDTSEPAVGIAEITIEAFDEEGSAVAATASVAGGAFEIDGLPAGNYKLKTTSSAEYIDRILGGNHCSPEPCIVSDSGTVIGIVNSDVIDQDIQLLTGLPITGTVTALGGLPLREGTAWLYSATAKLLKSTQVVEGRFSFPANAYGRYYMLVSNTSGLVDQLYDGENCPAGDCDIVGLGTPIDLDPPVALALMAAGAAGSFGSPQATDPPRIRFLLSAGYHISGSVHAMGKAVTFTKVYFFNEDGSVAGQAKTDGLGNFVSESGFPNGNYYAATSRAARPEDSTLEAAEAETGVTGKGLLNQVWDGFFCDGICGPPFSFENSTAIQVNGMDKSGINFELMQAPGVELQKLTNGVDADTPNGGNAPVIPPGETVNWTYRVTNIGGSELVNVDVTDSGGLTVSCPEVTLAPDESMDCTASAPAEDLSGEPFSGVIGNCAGIPSSRLYQNTGMVAAQTAGGAPVEARDKSHYCNPRKDLIFRSGFE